MLRALVPALLLLAGRVTDPLGAPAAGIEVWDLTAGRGPQRLAVTGADGRFTLPELQTDVFLELCGPGFLTDSAIARRGGGPVHVVLEPAARVAGRVLDAVTGSPVAGANVWGRQLTDSGLRCASFADGVCPRDRSARTTRTGPDGSFLVDHFEPGLYRLHVEAPGYLKALPLHLKLAAGEARVPDVLVERGAVLRGRVLGSDGKPLGEVRLFASSGRSHHNDVKSGADGRYVLTSLEPGLVWVHLHPPELDDAQRSVEVGPGENEADFRLSARTAHELRGRVVDAAGRPVAGARVRWQERGGGGGGAETQSAADGAFTFAAGDGVHELSAEAAGYAPGRLDGPVTVRGAPVEGLEIRLAAGVTLRGCLLGADPGRRHRGVVQAQQRGIFRQAELDAEGRFTLTDLGPGLWRVRAGVPGEETEAEVRIAPDEGEVALDLEVRPLV
ncbi:MAG TPA: carboxypeptidase-like regulatory domain-containing protein, partial [Thermoanaerobaculia bacterium]